MPESNCCGASIPNWPDNDLCSACQEHCEPVGYAEEFDKILEEASDCDNTDEMAWWINDQIYSGFGQADIMDKVENAFGEFEIEGNEVIYNFAKAELETKFAKD